MEGMKKLEKTIQIHNSYIASIFGEFDEHIKKIERAFDVTIVNRGDEIKLVGENLESAETVIQNLVKFAEKNEQITVQTVQYLIDLIKDGGEELAENGYDEFVCMTVNGRPIKAKTVGQKKYIDLIREKNVVFGKFTDCTFPL